MAKNEILVKFELRPCIVNGRKALFHTWNEKSQVIQPSPMVGGHGGGLIKTTVGIIEYEDGIVTECYPYEIKFCDNEFQKYTFTKED